MMSTRRRLLLQQAQQDSVRHELEIAEARRINTVVIGAANVYKVTDEPAMVCYYQFRNLQYTGYILLSEYEHGVDVRVDSGNSSVVYTAIPYTLTYGGKTYYMTSHGAAKAGTAWRVFTEEQMGCIHLNRVTGVTSYNTANNSQEYAPAAQDLLDYYFGVI